MVKLKALPLPDIYRSENCGNAGYSPDYGILASTAEVWVKRFGLKPASEDLVKILLLLIDDQVSFSFPLPAGSLFVAGRSGTGAINAHRMLVEWIYHYLHLISLIIPSMDTHLLYQIFFTNAHILKDGRHPPANTIITAEEYRRGIYRPSPEMAALIGVDLDWLQKQFTFYCEWLEASGKSPLYLWPYHTMLGSNGHRLAGVVEEARFFHGLVRGAANNPLLKGDLPLTEHYSIFSPEVMTTWDGRTIPGAEKNTQLMEKLLKAEMVVIAGLASSHCVKESVKDLLAYIRTKDLKLARKIYLLADCTAPVVIPGVVDFTDEAERAFQEFQAAGIHVVKSTDPIESWPGIPMIDKF